MSTSWLDVKCPTCGAEPGDYCRVLRPLPEWENPYAYAPHKPRRTAAKAATGGDASMSEAAEVPTWTLGWRLQRALDWADRAAMLEAIRSL